MKPNFLFLFSIFDPLFLNQQSRILSSTCEYDIVHLDGLAAAMLCKQLCILSQLLCTVHRRC
jgi:hypothetical protein